MWVYVYHSFFRCPSWHLCIYVKMQVYLKCVRVRVLVLLCGFKINVKFTLAVAALYVIVAIICVHMYVWGMCECIYVCRDCLLPFTNTMCAKWIYKSTIGETAHKHIEWKVFFIQIERLLCRCNVHVHISMCVCVCHRLCLCVKFTYVYENSWTWFHHLLRTESDCVWCIIP